MFLPHLTIFENYNEKSKKKQQLDGRGYKRICSKRLESKGYSESIVSGRLHQNSDLEVRKCGKTCKRGPAWSCDISNTLDVSCVISLHTPIILIHINMNSLKLE